MRIGLLRHGHTDWNRAGRLQGRTDRPLEEVEPARLARLALPEPWKDAAILSSPMIRAVETARIVSGKQPATDPRLTEMSFGDWEGKISLELQADPNSGFRDVEHWGWDYRPPNGESPREVFSRVSEAIAALKGDTLIVCHIAVMRAVLATAHGWNFEGEPPFKVKRYRIYGVMLDGSKMTADADPIRLVSR